MIAYDSTPDTVVAIATPPGRSAIGVVRISGPNAIGHADGIVRLAQGAPLASSAANLARLARIVDPDTGREVDCGIVTIMRAPASYTGEDVVEISCHGNPVVLDVVVRLLLARGSCLAPPGEFTRRAFLNGRLDLAQAEAVALLIQARTERAAQLASRQVAGALSDAVGTLRSRVLDVLAALEVALDFPDDAVGLSRSGARKEIASLLSDVDALLNSARRGRSVQDGLVIMLAGAPNAGKSSLFNRLAGRDRAIVSPIPGTTRDLLEAQLVIAGVPITLLDGAGLGHAADQIDAEGMRRSRDAADRCDLLVVVVDGSCPAPVDIVSLLERRADSCVLVRSKADLPSVWSEPKPDSCCSALTGIGIADLESRIEQWVVERTGRDGDEAGTIASLRVLEELERARNGLAQAGDGFECDRPIEAVLVDIGVARDAFDAVLGLSRDDAVLDRIFASFCVGK